MMHLLGAYLLSAMGLTVLVVWPDHGPSAWLRDRVLRRLLPRAARGVVDCYLCCGFWSGLLLSVAWWTISREPWVWFGCLMVPGLFWVLLRPDRVDWDPHEDKT